MFFVSGLQGVQRGAVAWCSRALMLCGGLLLFAVTSHAKVENVPSTRPTVTGVEIRRTTDGIPHVLAGSWHALGRGVGYAQAQDALCTLAEAFVTYEGRRSWFFGPDAKPARDSTFGRQKNLDLDFFFKAFANTDVLSQYRAQQPDELNELIEGFAAGYSRYVAEIRKTPSLASHRACVRAAWVREIKPDDVYRRLYAAQVAGGYAHFIAEIVNATPPPAQSAGAQTTPARPALRDRLAYRIGDREGVGSNMLAFGRKVTGQSESVLFGNPHWYWGGPDRFYQMHLTIPGRLNVAGVGFLGVPLVMIGFNDHVAWSHTVSAARRFGLFDLTLDEADPTRVRVDGQTEAMQARTVGVEVRDRGKPQQVTRTLYSTRFGPMVNLGGHNPAFGWGRAHALAIRDINAQNFGVFRNFFYWNQATSLDEFIAIQRREAAVPWVNTVAIGRGDGRVWYGDVGAVPNVPDDLRAACSTDLAKGFAQLDAMTPFLDGSRSRCDWRVEARAVRPGAMPADAMPGLLREDYVANMNDSYWLSNVRQPLEGFPSVLGGERQALSLRGRMGHQIAAELMGEKASSAQDLAARVRSAVLIPRAYSAERFKDELLAQACVQDLVDVPANEESDQVRAPARRANIAPACRVLRNWTGRADVDARGALLWESFWAELEKIPGDMLFSVPFSSEAPLQTPRAPRGTEDASVPRALAAAVVTLAAKGQRLDAPLGRSRFARTSQGAVPIYGGCDSVGYFTVACADDESGSARMGPDALANSYLQVVTFGPDGVQAHTLLAHGQDEQALLGGRGAAPVVRYASKAWLNFPFEEAQIARDPGLRRKVLMP